MKNGLLVSLVSSEESNICLRYWAQASDKTWDESTISLCQEFGLALDELESRVSANCVANVLDIRCRRCNSPRVVSTRARYEELRAGSCAPLESCNGVICARDQRQPDVKATASLANQRIDLVESELRQLQNALKPVDYACISFINAFYLYCLLIASSDGWFGNELPSVRDHCEKLAPTHLLYQTACAQLMREGIMTPSVNSPIFAFNVISPAHAPITFDFERVRWTIAESSTSLSKTQLLAALHEKINSGSLPNRTDLHQRLIEHECLGAIVNALTKIGVRISVSIESELYLAVRATLRYLPAHTAMLVIELVFLELKLHKKIRSASREKIGGVVSRAVAEYLQKMPLSKFSPDDPGGAANKVLGESDSVSSKVFFKFFSDNVRGVRMRC